MKDRLYISAGLAKIKPLGLLAHFDSSDPAAFSKSVYKLFVFWIMTE